MSRRPRRTRLATVLAGLAGLAVALAASPLGSPVLAAPAGTAAVGVAAKPAIWNDGLWYLRDSLSAGPATSVFRYGGADAEFAVMGDWDGDGDETVGVARWRPQVSDTLTWYLRNSNDAGPATVPAFDYDAVTFVAVDMLGTLPVVGDWDGDGDDTIGVIRYDQDFGGIEWRLRNSNTAGPPDLVFRYSVQRDRPVVGDWDGDGDDTPGVYREPNRFLLRNSATSGPADLSFGYGASGPGIIELPVVGDWDGDGDETAGVLRNRPLTDADGGFEHWLLRNSNSAGPADVAFVYGSDAFSLGLPIEFVPRFGYR